ncbi:MAG TPA: glycosyltransferase, partial [Flavobacterium sp.]|nr:glycosyltransferase [Flavobacterium sp.]
LLIDKFDKNLYIMEKLNYTTDTFLKKTEDASQYYDMIVFCHLRWQFVYQRPQHIISRMAKDYKILFIEEPVHFNENEENTGNLIKVNENLHVLQPRVRSIADIKNILPKFIINKNVEIGWFYSASFSIMLNEINFSTVVYDCMDELTLFKNAPQELIAQEKYLMQEASIVFTGGKSLYESKKQFHDNVYCFPSSVDQEHFAKAMNGIEIPEDIASIPFPIVGYFGVIDERLNLEMVNQTAQLQPDVSFVMIGPVAKISEEDLPRQKNIHYLGMKQYENLPQYLKAFTIAMMPFALNDATKFISPTKTLEYMAAGRPIISTPIKDVVRDYSSCVEIIETAEDFSKAIDTILKNPKDLSVRLSYKDILDKTSWNNTAAQMKKIIKVTK